MTKTNHLPRNAKVFAWPSLYFQTVEIRRVKVVFRDGTEQFFVTAHDLCIALDIKPLIRAKFVSHIASRLLIHLPNENNYISGQQLVSLNRDGVCEFLKTRRTHKPKYAHYRQWLIDKLIPAL
jgi:hypothetical protein